MAQPSHQQSQPARPAEMPNVEEEDDLLEENPSRERRPFFEYEPPLTRPIMPRRSGAPRPAANAAEREE